LVSNEYSAYCVQKIGFTCVRVRVSRYSFSVSTHKLIHGASCQSLAAHFVPRTTPDGHSGSGSKTILYPRDGFAVLVSSSWCPEHRTITRYVPASPALAVTSPGLPNAYRSIQCRQQSLQRSSKTCIVDQEKGHRLG